VQQAVTGHDTRVEGVVHSESLLRIGGTNGADQWGFLGVDGMV
jgi:hypothetical protein